jgi:hypothetical protein
MVKVRHIETCEFQYESEEERNAHVAEIEEEGWNVSPQIRQFVGRIRYYKDEHNRLRIAESKDEDYVWYGHFAREVVG